jgi:K+ transporter
MQPPVVPRSQRASGRYASRPRTLKGGLIMALAALGVVYGDLGTNTVLAIRNHVNHYGMELMKP